MTTLSHIAGAGPSGAFKLYLPVGVNTILQWDDLYTNSDLSCSIDHFEYMYGSSCTSTPDPAAHTFNLDNTITFHPPSTHAGYRACFEASTIGVGTCQSGIQMAYIEEMIYPDDFLIQNISPMLDQDFNFDSSISLASQFSLTGSNGFREFFDLDSVLEDGLTCELLASDCSSALTGT